MLRHPLDAISSLLLLVVDNISRLGIGVAVETNSVPGKLEEAVHILKGTTGSLRNEEPDPGTTNEGDSGKRPEGTHGRDSADGGGCQHVGHGTGVTVLVGKVKSHGP